MEHSTVKNSFLNQDAGFANFHGRTTNCEKQSSAVAII